MTALVAVFALLAGLIIAAVAAMTGMVLFLLGRARRVPPAQRTAPLFRETETRPRKTSDSDVIDVVATEVRSDSASR